MEPSSAAAYVVVKFDDRNRFGENGVPALRLFSGGARVVVRMKPATIEKAGKRSQCAPRNSQNSPRASLYHTHHFLRAGTPRSRCRRAARRRS